MLKYGASVEADFYEQLRAVRKVSDVKLNYVHGPSKCLSEIKDELFVYKDVFVHDGMW